jgi:centrosomal protein CEP19
MEKSTCYVAVGAALTDAVIIPVCKRHASAPTKALQQLCIASNACHADGSYASIEAWFAAMQRRYAGARREWLASGDGADAHQEVAAAVDMAAPGGCSGPAADLVDTALGVNGMLSESVPQATVEAHIAHYVARHAINGSGDVKISAADVVKLLVEGPVFDASAMRAGWWLKDLPASVTKRKVALRALPPALLVEYTLADAPSKRRQRTIHLDGQIREVGSVIPLARKIAPKVANLGLTDADVQRLLVKMQKLMKEAAEMDDLGDDDGGLDPTVAAYASGVGGGAAPTSSSSAASPADGPKKADLGLLYRDPDAALKDVDLQDADEVVVAEFKNKMGEKFAANALKPGDPGYTYDVRKEFKPVAKSEWDDSDDDEW